MVNPVKNIQRTAAEYRQMDKKDQRRFWVDGILNNALYILMVIFIIYTAFKNENFLKPGSIVNIISLAAASLPEQQTNMMSIMFSWPQGVTAICGGLLSWPIIARLKKTSL